MKQALLLALLATASYAQVTIPDGTRIRLRLDQTISSATAEEGQTVELSVTEPVKVDGQVVIKEGARATGTVVVAQEKRRMGRAGKLDFSVDRVRAEDGEWVPLRYTLNKKQGDSKAVSTGVITAGVAVVFWPAAPFMLLRHGKDIQVNKGVTVEVFTDSNHDMRHQPSQVSALQTATLRPGAPAMVNTAAPAMPMNSGDAASLTITSSEPGADIAINGSFVGNTPTTTKLAPGQYTVLVKSGTLTWHRVIQVTPGSSINLVATFPAPLQSVKARR
jgi:hypothetical protein